MIFEVETQRSGWFTLTATKFLATELPRLFAVLSDPAGWSVAAPERLVRSEVNSVLGYAFANGSRVEVWMDSVKPGVQRLRIEHENLHTDADAAWARSYWTELVSHLTSRLLAEPVAAAQAYGKLNLFFRVGSLLPNGYHEVASVYQSVSMAETVFAEPVFGPTADWQVTTGGSVSVAHLASVPTDKKNLVVKAFQAVVKAAKAKKVGKYHFYVDKHVPVSGGMGGGSADAAATLVLANQLLGSPLDKTALLEVAAELGADVPFALQGGTAIGTGTGHELSVFRNVSELHWVLVTDELGLSTPSVYKELDRLRTERGEDPSAARRTNVPGALVTALRQGASAEEIAPLLHNDLAEAAVSLRPDLKRLLDLRETVGALAAIISGSGPTVAYLASDGNDAIAVQSRLNTIGYRDAIIVSSPGKPARVLP